MELSISAGCRHSHYQGNPHAVGSNHRGVCVHRQVAKLQGGVFASRCDAAQNGPNSGDHFHHAELSYSVPLALVIITGIGAVAWFYKNLREFPAQNPRNYS